MLGLTSSSSWSSSLDVGDRHKSSDVAGGWVLDSFVGFNVDSGAGGVFWDVVGTGVVSIGYEEGLLLESLLGYEEGVLLESLVVSMLGNEEGALLESVSSLASGLGGGVR